MTQSLLGTLPAADQGQKKYNLHSSKDRQTCWQGLLMLIRVHVFTWPSQVCVLWLLLTTLTHMGPVLCSSNRRSVTLKMPSRLSRSTSLRWAKSTVLTERVCRWSRPEKLSPEILWRCLVRNVEIVLYCLKEKPQAWFRLYVCEGGPWRRLMSF